MRRPEGTNELAQLGEYLHRRYIIFKAPGRCEVILYDGVNSEILYVEERPQEIVSHCPRLADRGASGSPGRACQTAHIIGRGAVQTYLARTTSLYNDLHPKLM
jgi:hypothetical protein